MLLADWLRNAATRLQGHEQPAVEARVLASHVLGKSREWLLIHPDADIASHAARQMDQLLDRLALGTPLPYLTGQQEFFGLEFTVSPAVLIPRPETELLVETALDWLNRRSNPMQVVDVGTGSGCIAITLAVKVGLELTAVDVSRPALEIARKNASRHLVEDIVHFLQSDLLTSINGTFDLVCANLPYIPTYTLSNLEVARHEPCLALDGGPDGTSLICRLLDQLVNRINPAGMALLEFQAGDGAKLLSQARSRFPSARVEIKNDLAGHDRLLMIRT